MFTELSRAAAFIITFKSIRHAKKKHARKTLVDLLNALINDC
jgi:hypothetical protein